MNKTQILIMVFVGLLGGLIYASTGSALLTIIFSALFGWLGGYIENKFFKK